MPLLTRITRNGFSVENFERKKISLFDAIKNVLIYFRCNFCWNLSKKNKLLRKNFFLILFNRISTFFSLLTNVSLVQRDCRATKRVAIVENAAEGIA